MEVITLEIIEISNILQKHTVILSEFKQTVRVNFTITEETTYSISSQVIDFESEGSKSTLFDHEGNEIDVYIDNFTFTFIPGNYYIIYETSISSSPVIFETIFE